MAEKRTHLSLPSVPPALAGGLLLLTMAAVLGGCQPSAPPQAESPAPAETAPAAAPSAETATAQPTATTTPAPVAAQSNSTAQPAPEPPAIATAPATAALPNTLLKEWQPLSNVLVAFGPMTLTPDQVQWGSGQVSPYSLVSTEGGYLLKLADNPGFYDTQTAYIKLMPKADANGASTAMEVAFYTDEAKLQIDEYIMYGGYFVE